MEVIVFWNVPYQVAGSQAKMCSLLCILPDSPMLFMGRQGRDNLFSKELARLARPVYFVSITLSEFMQWVLVLYGFFEWKPSTEAYCLLPFEIRSTRWAIKPNLWIYFDVFFSYTDDEF